MSNKPNTAPLLGLGGLMRSGKDTLADALVSLRGYTKLNFSEPLVRAAAIIDPLIADGLRYSEVLAAAEGDLDLAKKQPEVRRTLQRVGDALRALYGSEALTGIIEQQAGELLEAGKPVVITGVRFPAELAMIRRLGGAAIWIERAGTPASAHVTENSLSASDFDSTILNDYETARSFGWACYTRADERARAALAAPRQVDSGSSPLNTLIV